MYSLLNAEPKAFLKLHFLEDLEHLGFGKDSPVGFGRLSDGDGSWVPPESWLRTSELWAVGKLSFLAPQCPRSASLKGLYEHLLCRYICVEVMRRLKQCRPLARGVPVAGSEGSPAGTHRWLSACPWLGARAAQRGLVAGSQGCPWLWAGDLSPALTGARGWGRGRPGGDLLPALGCSSRQQADRKQSLYCPFFSPLLGSVSLP